MPITYEDKRVQIELALAELRRREDSQNQRMTRSETISGVLIAGSALTAGLFAESDGDWWLRAAMLLSLVAAGLGIASLVPRGVPGTDPLKLRDTVLAATDLDANIRVIDMLVTAIDIRDRVINGRMRLAQWALGALASALVCGALSTIGLQVTATVS